MDEVDLDGLLAQLEKTVDSLVPLVKQLVVKPLNERISNTASPAQNVQIINNYTNLLIQLLVSYLRLLGENPQKHAVQQEVERVERYIAKFKNQQVKDKKSIKAADEAAKRFINAAISTSTPSVLSVDAKPKVSKTNGDTGKVQKPEKKMKKKKKKINS